MGLWVLMGALSATGSFTAREFAGWFSRIDARHDRGTYTIKLEFLAKAEKNFFRPQMRGGRRGRTKKSLRLCGELFGCGRRQPL